MRLKKTNETKKKMAHKIVLLACNPPQRFSHNYTGLFSSCHGGVLWHEEQQSSVGSLWQLLPRETGLSERLPLRAAARRTLTDRS